MFVQLEFVGHACFRLWQDGRATILMDPYTPTAVNLDDDGTRLQADTVIVSSLTDASHDNVKLAAGNPRVINALDVARGSTITHCIRSTRTTFGSCTWVISVMN